MQQLRLKIKIKLSRIEALIKTSWTIEVAQLNQYPTKGITMIIIRRADMSDKDIARFLAKVDKSGDCWVWQGSKRHSGKGGNEYGVIGFAGKVVYVHRFSYALAYGECPANLVIDHKCRKTLCVNPNHLHAVTQSVNMQNLGESYKNSKTGIRGVVWRKDKNKFEAEVESGGRNYFGGYYADIHDAEKAAIALRNKLMTNNRQDRRNQVTR